MQVQAQCSWQVLSPSGFYQNFAPDQRKRTRALARGSPHRRRGADHSSLKGLMITGATETLLRLRRLCGYYYLDKMILIRLCIEALGVKHAGNNSGEGDEDGE